MEASGVRCPHLKLGRSLKTQICGSFQKIGSCQWGPRSMTWPGSHSWEAAALCRQVCASLPLPGGPPGALNPVLLPAWPPGHGGNGLCSQYISYCCLCQCMCFGWDLVMTMQRIAAILTPLWVPGAVLKPFISSQSLGVLPNLHKPGVLNLFH